jgi:hypothetical protein
MSGLGDCFRISNLRRGPPILLHATRRLRRPPELTVRGCVDAAGFKAAFSCAERPAACRFRRGRPATSFDRQRGRGHRRLAWLPDDRFSCQHRLAKRAARVFNQTWTCVWTLQLASLRVRPARGSRVGPMPVWGRYVALATDHEQDAAPSRDIRCDLRSRVVRPSRRRNAIP